MPEIRSRFKNTGVHPLSPSFQKHIKTYILNVKLDLLKIELDKLFCFYSTLQNVERESPQSTSFLVRDSLRHLEWDSQIPICVCVCILYRWRLFMPSFYILIWVVFMCSSFILSLALCVWQKKAVTVGKLAVYFGHQGDSKVRLLNYY